MLPDKLATAIQPGFNPRPAPKSGAIQLGGSLPYLKQVSIRAPLRRAGRFAKSKTNNAAVVFQSAPRSEERGDVR